MQMRPLSAVARPASAAVHGRSPPAARRNRAPQARQLDDGLAPRQRYPAPDRHRLAALLTTSAATIGIPYGFKRVIDRGFGPRRGDAIDLVPLSADDRRRARAGDRGALLFRLLARRARRRGHPRRGAAPPAALTPRFFEENRPSEIASRLTPDTTLIEGVVGTTVSVALRNASPGSAASSICSRSRQSSPAC